MGIRAFYQNCKRHFIFPHLLFWITSIILFTVVLVFTRGDFNFYNISLRIAVNILMTIGFLAVSVYINYLWLIPTFFYKRKFGLFLVLEIVNILLFIALNYYFTYLFEGGDHPNFFSEIVAEFILVMIFLMVSTLIKFTRDSITLQDVELRIKEVEKQKVEAELRALKAQINPHFFFNTLNSLYSLSLDKSDKAPELILKLSDLMRFIIYESSEDLVSMEKQLEFMKNYVFLENLRNDENLKVVFNVKGSNIKIKVAPLLYLVFIENAFKHGSKAVKDRPFIEIDFNLEREDRVGFIIRNCKDSHTDFPQSSGVGLANVRKRLELLYPQKHVLTIRDTENQYYVELTIELS